MKNTLAFAVIIVASLAQSAMGLHTYVMVFVKDAVTGQPAGDGVLTTGGLHIRVHYPDCPYAPLVLYWDTPDATGLYIEQVDHDGFFCPGRYTITVEYPGAYYEQSKGADVLLPGDVVRVDFNLLPLPNEAPTVDAGPDLSTTDLFTPQTVQLNGSVSDDKPQYLRTRWQKVSGPGAVSFADPADPQTTATFDELGNYELRLTAWDPGHMVSDTVTVYLGKLGLLLPYNEPPVSPPDIELPVSPPCPPVAHWMLDEGSGWTATDASGRNHHGTLKGNPQWVAGPAGLGNALAFDGDDYVDVPHAPDLNIARALTVAAWVRTQDAGSGRHIPYVTRGDHSYALKHHWQNNLEFFIYDGDWRVVHVPVDTSFNGVWHHLAGTYDGWRLRLYVDGVLKATQEHIGSIAPSLFNVNIGRNTECIDRFYEGRIDDVRIYDCALTAEQIQGLLQGPAAGLRAHWKLDETAGATAQDSVGNYHGTVQGNPVWRPQGGEIGGALAFDGNGDGVVIPKVGDSVAFTYALWVKQNVIGQGLIALIDHKQWVPGSVHFELRDGHPKVGINGVIWPEGDLDAPAYTLGVGAWYHLALTKSASELALYVNGELAAYRPLTMSGSVILGDGSLGRWLDPTASRPRDFNGLLDEVRIYDRALSVEEIRTLAWIETGN